MDKLIKVIKQFVEERDWEQFHNPKNLAMGLNIETAELMELFLWISSDTSDEHVSKIRNELSDELGDVFIYLIMLAERVGIDLVEAALKKVEKNRQKYPVERAKGSSLKYTDK